MPDSVKKNKLGRLRLYEFVFRTHFVEDSVIIEAESAEDAQTIFRHRCSDQALVQLVVDDGRYDVRALPPDSCRWCGGHPRRLGTKCRRCGAVARPVDDDPRG